MRFIRYIIVLVAVSLPLLTAKPQMLVPQSPKREVRAVWLTTIGGLDWPHTYATNAAQRQRQQRQLCEILDNIKEAGINVVLLQTRIRSTVAYPSEIEPWDGAFSGRPGVSPGYDPLKFAIDECHKRGMQLHAWVVCTPICSKQLARQLGHRALPKRHPELCKLSGDKYMMNPGVPATADYLASICAEIVRNYDVDGINLDYIRYPEKELAFDDRSTYRLYGRGMSKSAWRKANITRCVRRIHDTVKAIKPWVVLSCSPVGKHADLPLHSSRGWNALEAVSQEAQAWLADGLMDWLFPMMYFKGEHFYPFALDWAENRAGRVVAPGLGIYMMSAKEKNWGLNTIVREMNFVRQIGMGGTAYFRTQFLADNTKGLRDYMCGLYCRTPALPPPMTWVDSVAPQAPRGLSMVAKGSDLRLKWGKPYDPTPGDRITYNLYRSPTWPIDTEDVRNLIRAGIDTTELSLFVPLPATKYAYYAVRAVDRYGNEGVAAAFNPPAEPEALHFLPCDGTSVRLPLVESRDIGLLSADGKQIATLQADTVVNVSDLPQGIYQLRTQRRSRKSRGQRIGFFVKKP